MSDSPSSPEPENRKVGASRVQGFMDDWQTRAGSRVREAVEGRLHPLAFHHRSIIATLRTSYRQLSVPAPFETLEVETCGGLRRVAAATGRGRPIMIMPGMYGSLGEELFIKLADLARRRLGRPVFLLEDRFATDTVRLNGASVPSLHSLGEEVASVAAWIGERPEALALSAGAASTVAAPSGTFVRATLWSAATDPDSVVRSLSRHPFIRAYFARLHRRAFKEAGVAGAPSLAVLARRLASDRPQAPEDLPVLAIHARDDPVAPLEPLLEAAHSPFRLELLRGGGHLGFGGVAGEEVYLLPLEREPL